MVKSAVIKKLSIFRILWTRSNLFANFENLIEYSGEKHLTIISRSFEMASNPLKSTVNDEGRMNLSPNGPFLFDLCFGR